MAQVIFLVFLIFTVSLATTCSVLANVVPPSDISDPGATAAASSSVSGDGSAVMKTDVSTTSPSAIEAGMMQVFNTQAPALSPSKPEVALTSAPVVSIPSTTGTSTAAPAAPAPVASSSTSPAPASVPTAPPVTPVAMASAAKKEEAALINEVVSKVLESDPKSIENNTSINVIDVSGKPVGPAGTAEVPSSANTSSTPSVKGLLNDPNTLLVLVDNSKSNSTAQAPKAALVPVTSSTMAPQSPYNKTSTAALVNSIINDPKNDNKNISVVVEVFKSPSVMAPAVNATKPPLMNTTTTTIKPVKANSTTPAVKVPTTTMKPTTSSTSTKPPTTTSKPSSSAAPSTTKKAKESLTDLLLRHERERKELEAKLKGDKSQRKQNDKDAQIAIKTLQAGRGHSTDNKLHQLEHNRQMALDPIGHTLKHQQYELSKQRLLSGL